MSKPFALFSDSSCDILPEILTKRNIRTIPFYVSFDQETYKKEQEEISLSEFYDVLTGTRIFPKTSLPTIEDYRKQFSAALKEGLDVVCLCITPLFSGSYQAAVTARSILLEKYPEASVRIVNSMQATGGQGLTVLAAADLRDAGCSADQTADALEAVTDTSRIIFTVGTLEYLTRGGRIGKAASLAGSILHLQPLIELYGGELMPYGTVRGRKKALTRIVEITGDYFAQNGLSFEDYTFGIIRGHSSEEEAEEVKLHVEEMIKEKITLPLFPVGVTIGVYTGPDPVGITFIRKPDLLR